MHSQGRHNAFADSFAQWLKDISAAQLVMLISTDSALRLSEREMSGPQLRFLSSAAMMEKARANSWLPLEAETVGEVLKRGSVSQKVHAAARAVRDSLVDTRRFVLLCPLCFLPPGVNRGICSEHVLRRGRQYSREHDHGFERLHFARRPHS